MLSTVVTPDHLVIGYRLLSVSLCSMFHRIRDKNESSVAKNVRELKIKLNFEGLLACL